MFLFKICRVNIQNDTKIKNLTNKCKKQTKHTYWFTPVHQNINRIFIIQ